MRGRVLQKVGDFARREGTVALPAAKRAVGQGVQAYLKKFSEEYAKKSKKLYEQRPQGRSRFGTRGPR